MVHEPRHVRHRKPKASVGVGLSQDDCCPAGDISAAFVPTEQLLHLGGPLPAHLYRSLAKATLANIEASEQSRFVEIAAQRWRHHLPLSRSWNTTSSRPLVVTISQ
jgi:hypothetical protein